MNKAFEPAAIEPPVTDLFISLDHLNPAHELRADHFPDTLTSLYLHGSFNQPLNNILPVGLKHLMLYGEWNQPINWNAFPPALETIKLGDQYRQPLGILPNTVRYLSLGSNYDHLISGPSLHRLDVSSPTPRFDIAVPFTHLRSLNTEPLLSDMIANITSQMFPALVELSIQQVADLPPILNLMKLPVTLRSLAIPIQGRCLMPDGLEEANLTFSPINVFGQLKLNGLLPPTVTKLTLNTCSHSLRSGDIPASVTSLKLWDYPHHLDFDILPNPGRLHTLDLSFNQSVLNDFSVRSWSLKHLPKSVNKLRLASGRQSFNLHRISGRMFLHVSDDLQRSGFIKMNTALSMFEPKDDKDGISSEGKKKSSPSGTTKTSSRCLLM
ncbi:hypothetical protein SAMD00019534_058010 [Acytostelium subglobosum LB1]|uniref:hypothetical protein n=1 Tax=Acytostelium subglobosum LB1 TaxID=1410327 RepID=UPI000644F474|nr:hypothetical protein SAMD00019534_058010 [Acytostelium subglobosum LB1]GAM22626.1 hypothetical protein SAMD00019534_058010 [Acytostelium subglobosum LB1]|eukprot:XP_012754746.1 hypothetical protein SAMD00019534_058010 [Acytostelium subglobosum LB1]